MGTLGGLVAGIATSLGAVPALIGKTLSLATSTLMLGFAAGVMLSASYFSLILPGIAAAEAQHGSLVIAALIAGAGIAMGAGFVAFLNASIPHEHFVSGREGADARAMARIWLFVMAITIHNFPEGLSIGVAFGGGDATNGLSVMTGISLQDMPEGLAVAVALISQGYSRWRAFVVATLTGPLKPLTNRGLVAAFVRRPFGSLRVLALIHWQALKLWAKGARYRNRPLAPQTDVSR